MKVEPSRKYFKDVAELDEEFTYYDNGLKTGLALIKGSFWTCLQKAITKIVNYGLV